MDEELWSCHFLGGSFGAARFGCFGGTVRNVFPFFFPLQKDSHASGVVLLEPSDCAVY